MKRILFVMSAFSLLFSSCMQNECTPNHHTLCRDAAVYWVDSCGVEGNKADDCVCGCNIDYDGCKEPCDCLPQCDGKQCGPNSCGGECGPGCSGNQLCNDTMGLCEDCEPDCGSRVCGPVPNGCGDSCGSCQTGSCNTEGVCVSCVADILHDQVVCEGGAEWWLDNCGAKNDKVKDCDCGCDGDICKTACAADAPIIISLSTNNPILDESGQLVVSAVVSDPDGVDDVIGGQLQTDDRSATYKTFATSAAEGAYSATLIWSEIDAVSPINGPSGGTSINLRAVFYDQAGHEVSKTLEITLKCVEATLGICDAECHDFKTNEEHCGGCNQPVSPSNALCVDGQSQCPGVDPDICENLCVDLDSDNNHCGSCNHPVIPVSHCENGQIVCNNTSQIVCNSKCTSIDYDDENCGACGNSCLALSQSHGGDAGDCNNSLCDAVVRFDTFYATCDGACLNIFSAPCANNELVSCNGSSEIGCYHYQDSASACVEGSAPWDCSDEMWEDYVGGSCGGSMSFSHAFCTCSFSAP